MKKKNKTETLQKPWLSAIRRTAAPRPRATRTGAATASCAPCGCSEREAMQPAARASREEKYREFQSLEKTGTGNFQSLEKASSEKPLHPPRARHDRHDTAKSRAASAKVTA